MANNNKRKILAYNRIKLIITVQVVTYHYLFFLTLSFLLTFFQSNLFLQLIVIRPGKLVWIIFMCECLIIGILFLLAATPLFII